MKELTTAELEAIFGRVLKALKKVNPDLSTGEALEMLEKLIEEPETSP